MKKTITLILILLALTPFCFAAEKTVKTIEIPLTYQALTLPNIIYYRNITIDLPDKISKILSMEVIIKGDYNVPTNVFAGFLINGQAIFCSPNFYLTPGNANNYETSFDCTDILNGWKGSNTPLTFAWLSDKNFTNTKPRLKLTYYNDPPGTLQVSGTEYSPGDPATIFLQLQDNSGFPINNGSCNTDIYYPLNSSGLHPFLIQNAPMLQALGNNGLYYYDLNAPSILGVYMVSAKCSYAFDWIWYYGQYELVYKPLLQNNSGQGTWFGDSISLNSPNDASYLECDVAGLGVGCQANFSFNLSVYGNLTNITTINLYYSGQLKSSGSNPWDLYLSYWNGTTFVNLPNSLHLEHQAIAPSGVDQYLTNSVPTTAIINNKIIIKYNLTGGSGTGGAVYNHWLSMAMLSSSGSIQNVKGSSELHVTNIPNATVILVNTQSPQYVWNYTNRVSTANNTQQIAQYVWNYTTRNLTFYPNINISGINISVTINSSEIAQAVWNYTNRNLTFYPSVNYTEIQGYVWNASIRNLTYYPIQPDLTNYSLISDYVWNYTARYTHGIILN